jgi:osmotically-inducible protein OsmY
MNTLAPRRLPASLALALLAALAGCQRQDDETVGQRVDEILGRTQQAANDLEQGGRQAAQDARQSMGAGPERKEPGQEPGQGASRGQDEPSSTSLGTKVDDAGITAKVKTGLSADKDLAAGKIEVDTQGGVVTLKGEVPNPAARSRADQIARNVKNVKSVNNQLAVKAG